MKRVILVLSLVALCFGGVGCSSLAKTWKGWVGSDSGSKKKRRKRKRVGKFDKKKYRKVTHKSMQDEAALGEESGSLWVPRGQGAYLFHQNTNRLLGDLLNVKIEGHPKDQIETKVKVIEDLIQKIKQKKEARRLAKRKRRKGKKGRRSVAQAPAPPPPKSGNNEFPIKVVPTRITEIMKDGSYRIRGDQPFMIGKREYKLVVTGIVRQADFDDQGIEAETLLDPKFDIVTAKKGKG